MRKDTGIIKSIVNWATGTGRTVRHSTTIWGRPRVEVTDYDRGYRSVRVKRQGFWGNKDSYVRKGLNGDWHGKFNGSTELFSGRHSGDYEGICFRCDGHGLYKGRTCRRCGGTGRWHKHHG